MIELGNQRIGVCLSSGYFGFYAHGGFMKALGELGIVPVGITGCSAGAVLGAYWAAGVTSSRFEEILCSVGLDLLIDPPPLALALRSPLGLVAGRRFERLVEQTLPVRTFEQCPIPFAVTTFDLNEARLRIIDRGPIARAVRASASLPGMFVPALIDGHLCWDGAVAEKIPLAPLVERPDIDTILVCHLRREPSVMPPRSIIAGLRLALDTAVGRLDDLAIAEARRRGKNVWILRPRVPPAGPHRLGRGTDIVEIARRETRRILSDEDFSDPEVR